MLALIDSLQQYVDGYFTSTTSELAVSHGRERFLVGCIQGRGTVRTAPCTSFSLPELPRGGRDPWSDVLEYKARKTTGT